MTEYTTIRLEPVDVSSGEDVVAQVQRASKVAELTGSFVEVRAGAWDIYMSPFTINLKSD